MTHINLPTVAFNCVLGLVLASGCVDNTVTSTGKQGGIRNNPGTCQIGVANTAFSAARLHGERTQPLQCPYKVDYQNEFIAFVANLYGPSDLVPADGGATVGPIISTQDGWAVLPSQSQYWTTDPNLSGGLTLQFTGNYQSAHIAPDVYPWATDSGAILVDRTVYGPARAFITLTGTSFTSGDTYVATTGGISVEAQTTLRAVPSVDTNSYHFSWSVDGQAVPGNDDALLHYTFGLPGNHTVTAFASYQTGVETVQSTVSVAMVALVEGPTLVDPNAGAGHWDAVVPGGFPPYTYQWSVDGIAAGTNSYLDRYFGPGESHDIEVTVRDSHGFSALGVTNVFVTAGGTCLQEPCP